MAVESKRASHYGGGFAGTISRNKQNNLYRYVMLAIIAKAFCPQTEHRQIINHQKLAGGKEQKHTHQTCSSFAYKHLWRISEMVLRVF